MRFNRIERNEMKAQIEIVRPAVVVLGADEGIQVRRTLPTRKRSLIGAWCFLDHYGPLALSKDQGMSVGPHPHAGLQTASWLFAGEVEHRDSAGNHVIVRPGELNLMTAGRGISHSEKSLLSSEVLHGVQLWIALPQASRFIEPAFEHFIPEMVDIPGGRIRVFLGSLLGTSSPVMTHTQLVGAELELEAGVELVIPVNPAFEYGLLIDHGAVEVNGEVVAPQNLCFIAREQSTIHLRTTAAARVLVLGGEPLNEEILMWWNFIGRTNEEIIEFRNQWQREILDSAADAPIQQIFGLPIGEVQSPMSAPKLPPVRLKARG